MHRRNHCPFGSAIEEFANGRKPTVGIICLALFLADHNRRLPEAVKIAEAVAAVRHDICRSSTLFR
jgi:hypothetical protein